MLSIGVGMLLQALTLHFIMRDAHKRFEKEARNIQYVIAADIKAYTDVLRGAASFFRSAEVVGHDSFRRYVHGLELPRHYPAIAGVDFAPYASRSEPIAISLTAPAPARGPALPSAAAPAWAPVAAQLCDSGMLSAVAMPLQTTAKPQEPALQVRLALYRPDVPPMPLEQRRLACIGSVGTELSLRRLMLGAMAELALDRARLVLREPAAPSPAGAAAAPLLDITAGGRLQQEGQLFLKKFEVNLSGRRWQAEFSAPKQSLYSTLDVMLPWLALLVGFGGSTMVYILFQTLWSSRRRAIGMAGAMTKELRLSQLQLQRSHHQLRRLAARAEQVKEEERKRIAREIHDDLGQNLLALRMEAEALSTRASTRHPRLHRRAQQTLEQIDSAIRSVRQIINDLRPNVLDLSLGAAVEWQLEQFRRRVGLVCELMNELTEDCGSAIDEHCAIAYFRILQESLNNIRQHACASVVWVQLSERDGLLCMTISDNGVGLPSRSRSKRGSFGLLGIEERIRLLGGLCTIAERPGGGTTVRVSVPLHRIGALEDDSWQRVERERSADGTAQVPVSVPRPAAGVSWRTIFAVAQGDPTTGRR